jgi:hypothetical protein
MFHFFPPAFHVVGNPGLAQAVRPFLSIDSSLAGTLAAAVRECMITSLGNHMPRWL